MRKRKYDRITAMLRDDLNWQRVSYMQCTMVYKCLHMAVPVYLAEMCVPVAASTGRQCLRSASWWPDCTTHKDRCVKVRTMQFCGLWSVHLKQFAGCSLVDNTETISITTEDVFFYSTYGTW